ncbi:MAG: ribonuclease Y [Chloroflexota bacterium]|nr:ribonuclease Y [Chloroflexota bacterium]GIK63099.1 MAG: ribonuclease Y [Chloroflexota bacterium]
MEIITAVVGLVVGLIAASVWITTNQKRQGTNKIQQAEAEAQRIMSEAEANKKKIEIEAKNEALHIQEENERNAKKRRLELDREEERQTKRREEFDKRLEKFEQREKELNRRQSNLDKRNNELQKLWDERTAELERVAEMTREEARQELLAAVEKDTRQDMVRLIRQIEEEAKSEADNRARDIIALSIQRLASDQVSEIAVSVVPLPSDDMKGRIIGRAGRNIRAFEQATGVDVVVDDTPEAVTISSFDPVRREVAKRALSKLVLDGRIHPARIEKLVEDTRKEVERAIREEGERASYEAGVPGLHPEILKLLGKLKFRTSYGQNMHAHAIETAHLAGMIAAELGADVNLSKAGGLLHDIGKAIDHEVEGPHAIIGAEFCKRYGVPEKIVNCIASHHHEVPQESVEALIVEAADAISGARPGARRESLDAYIKRVRMLEDIANAFTGVEQSYALQAGREVRIMVRPDDIDDLAAVHLARDISKKIEETMQYPGQIKVTIIRETRAVDYAR